MKPRSILEMLTDFSSEPDIIAVEEVVEEPIHVERTSRSPFLKPEPEPEFDLNTFQEMARQSGRDEVRAELTARYEARLRELEETCKKQLAGERRRWVEEEALGLRASLQVAVGEVEHRIADQIATVLKGYLTGAAVKKSVGVFARAVHELLQSGDKGAVVKVKGPADLLDAVKAQFADQAIAIAYEVADRTELCAELDDRIIETCIKAHIQGVRRAPQEQGRIAVAEGPRIAVAGA